MTTATKQNPTHEIIKHVASLGLTKQRAEEAEAAARKYAKEKNISVFHTNRSSFLTATELVLVRQVWDSLPGSSSWSSAWNCILKQEDWYGVPVRD